MLQQIINEQRNTWLLSESCPVTSLLNDIRKKGKMRDAQIEAIATYLFLKLKADALPLSEMMGKVLYNIDAENAPIHLDDASEKVRGFYAWAKAQKETVYDAVRLETKNTSENQSDLAVAADGLFYGVAYPDYLMSLPMGAGKTYLMAAIIYLDLYFAKQYPNDKRFAHNFLIVAPSGLKTSIVPSLRTIRNFNPEWILPTAVAHELKQLLQFEVLDDSKSAKKSNATRNPNALRVLQHEPFASLKGLVIIVNAEKVILSRTDEDKKTGQTKTHQRTEAENKKYENELRQIIGQIPNLQIHVDEVHHATSSENKLRKVISEEWFPTGNLNGLIGYSGTPFLYKAERIPLSSKTFLKTKNITNTVFYYPLKQGIGNFLKRITKPTISDNGYAELIKEAVNEFEQKFVPNPYPNGERPKLAIYCTSIEGLYLDVYPLLLECGINEERILCFHGEHKKHKITPTATQDFELLDSPRSVFNYILLVQIGKEGWDCRSLTGVVLSQQGKGSDNSVLQAACRCLRIVPIIDAPDASPEDKAANRLAEKNQWAKIWLNSHNAAILNAQLDTEQKTNLNELVAVSEQPIADIVERFDRRKTLNLPDTLRIKQLRLQTTFQTVEENANTSEKLNTILLNIQGKISSKADIFRIYKKNVRTVTETNIDNTVLQTKVIHDELDKNPISCLEWTRDLYRYGFGSSNAFNFAALWQHKTVLLQIFNLITAPYTSHVAPSENTTEYETLRLPNKDFYTYNIEQDIRLAFHKKRTILQTDELIDDNVQLVLLHNKFVLLHDALFPNTNEKVKAVLNADKGEYTEAVSSLKNGIDALSKMPNMEQTVAGMDILLREQLGEIAFADRTFHYLPYDFRQSNAEKQFLLATLYSSEMKAANIRTLYNGDRSLTGFKIKCYEKITTTNGSTRWKSLGVYTPDFLIIKQDPATHRITHLIIVEIKGKGFEDQAEFLKRRAFVETYFIPQNNAAQSDTVFHYAFVEAATKNNYANDIVKIIQTLSE